VDWWMTHPSRARSAGSFSHHMGWYRRAQRLDTRHRWPSPALHRFGPRTVQRHVIRCQARSDVECGWATHGDTLHGASSVLRQRTQAQLPPVPSRLRFPACRPVPSIRPHARTRVKARAVHRIPCCGWTDGGETDGWHRCGAVPLLVRAGPGAFKGFWLRVRVRVHARHYSAPVIKKTATVLQCSWMCRMLSDRYHGVKNKNIIGVVAFTAK
jgi:hypothetical protein